MAKQIFNIKGKNFHMMGVVQLSTYSLIFFGSYFISQFYLLLDNFLYINLFMEDIFAAPPTTSVFFPPSSMCYFSHRPTVMYYV